MNDLIRRFLEWVSAVLAPRAGGRHRACPEASAPHVSAVVPSLPALRSPYGLDTPLNGEDVALIRPYLVGVA